MRGRAWSFFIQWGIWLVGFSDGVPKASSSGVELDNS